MRRETETERREKQTELRQRRKKRTERRGKERRTEGRETDREERKRRTYTQTRMEGELGNRQAEFVAERGIETDRQTYRTGRFGGKKKKGGGVEGGKNSMSVLS